MILNNLNWFSKHHSLAHGTARDPTTRASRKPLYCRDEEKRQGMRCPCAQAEEGPQLTPLLLLLLGPPPWQEPEKGPAAEIHTHAVGTVTGTGAVDESSDSEPEQDGPQKLIRKVSTSGQIRSKVRHVCSIIIHCFVFQPNRSYCCFLTIVATAFCCSRAQSVKKTN